MAVITDEDSQASVRSYLLNSSPWKVISNGNIELAVLGEVREASGRAEQAQKSKVEE